MKIRPLPEPWRSERRAARRLFRLALSRGDIVEQNRCEECGRKQEKGKRRNSLGGISAHHFDYSKPLSVQWLCHWCHGAADFEMDRLLKALPPPPSEVYPTHCRHGHEMTEANIRRDKWGYRSCRRCSRIVAERKNAEARLATIARKQAKQAAKAPAATVEEALGPLYGANSPFELVPSVDLVVRGEVS